MIGRVLVAIIALFLLLGAFASPITNGIKTWRTDSLTQTPTVVTGEGITTANVTLTSARLLFQADVSNVQITSSITESPVASAYVEVSKDLFITGLTAGQTRVLTITYLAETEDSVMGVLGPFLGILIFGGIIGALFWGVFKGKG